MAVKARPGEGAFSQDNTSGRGFSTPPGNPRVPPGSRVGSPRKGPPPGRSNDAPSWDREGHGTMTRAGQERTRVDTDTR
jgi:hypothetical protein